MIRLYCAACQAAGKASDLGRYPDQRHLFAALLQAHVAGQHQGAGHELRCDPDLGNRRVVFECTKEDCRSQRVMVFQTPWPEAAIMLAHCHHEGHIPRIWIDGTEVLPLAEPACTPPASSPL